MCVCLVRVPNWDIRVVTPTSSKLKVSLYTAAKKMLLVCALYDYYF